VSVEPWTAETAAYGRFVGPPSRAELERFFYLDDTDKRLVAKRRGDHNRAGFALQLGTVRFLGAFLSDPTGVPVEVVAYVVEQVGAGDASCLNAYMGRRATRFEHAAEIVAAYGYRDFAGAEAQLVRWLGDRAWTTGEGPTALLDGAVRWLRERLVLLPGVTTLERLVARERDAATLRVWTDLAQPPSGGQARLLRGLLVVPDGARRSELDRMRKAETVTSGAGMVRALRRVSDVSRSGLGGLDVSSVPPRRVVALARYGMAAKATALRRHPEPRRLATLVATVRSLEAKAVDDALELFDVLMTNDLLARAARESRKEKLRRYPRLSKDAGKLAAAVEVLLDALDHEEQLSFDLVWEQIESKVSRAELRAAVAHLLEVAPPADADPDGEWRTALIDRFASVRAFVALLCETIAFGATAQAAQVLTAMKDLPGLLEARATTAIPAGYLDARRVAEDVVPAGWWRRLVYSTGRPEGTVDRAAYVFCVLEQFHRHLLRRDIYATPSARWGDPRAQLLTGPAWEAARAPALNALGVPEDPSELLAEHADRLDGAWRQLADGLIAGSEVQVDADGRLHADKIDAVPDPPSLVDLRRRLEGMIPRVDLPDLILEVMAWHPAFVAAFTGLSGGRTRLGDLHVTVAAALTAHALNVGYVPVISEGVPALTRGRISHVDQNYLRPENYTAANAVLIDAQDSIALARQWGGGLVAGIDGMRFVVPVRSLHARPNPKYFGRRRGATWLNMISDQAVGLAGRVLSGTPRDSLHMIDLIYSQDAGQRPEVIVTDTGSYSDIAFGLITLLDFDYRPQLADLPDAKLWRIDPSADYGPLNSAARGKIDRARIRRQWPDIVRVVASIHTGAVPAYDILRVLAPGGTPTQLGDALAHYGRIFKTLHVLSYVDDEPYRRDIKAIRNLQEGRHDLARTMFHGHKGELRHGYREGMEDQLGALGLILNTITLWNTVYLDHALDQLRATGYPVLDADVARLSPYMRRHINFHGHYSFAIPDLRGARRALRDPDAPDDD
jgi:TnpA family transposase